MEIRVEKRTADLRAANLQLRNVIDERRRLENELLEIAENERRRIGLDLHDDLGQKLTGVSMMLKGLERKLAAKARPEAAEARKIQSLTEELILHTHNLAHHFSALDVVGDNLSSVLKSLARNVKKMFGVACDFTVKGQVPALPKDTTAHLYKIAQEAVSNAIRHGKATRVSICLARNGGQLLLTIKSNGLPFSTPPQGRKRLGLRIMNYRANTIGAALEIKSNNKTGTIVSCAVPIN